MPIATTGDGGFYSYTASNLEVGSTYTPNVYCSTNPYFSNYTTYSSFTIQPIEATINVGNIYQISGSTEVFIDGIVTNSTFGNIISYVEIVVNGFDAIGNAITNTDGYFSYTTNSLKVATYTPNVFVLDLTYASNTYSYNSLSLTYIPATINLGNIYQLYGTSEIYLDGTVTKNLLLLSNANVLVSGIDVNTLTTTNAYGFYKLTTSLTIGNNYTPNVTVVDSYYTSSTYEYSSLTISKLPIELSNTSITEIPGTLTVKLQGSVKFFGNVVTDSFTIIGLDSNVTTTTDTNGYFMYTSGSLVPYTTYSFTLNSSTYSDASIGSITISPISATITPVALTQIPGTDTANVQGILTNTFTSAVIPNKTIIISGFDGVEFTTTTNSDGTFGYSSASLTIGNTYVITGNVFSLYYSTESTNLGNLTVTTIPVTINTGNIYQIGGTSEVFMDGTLTNSYFNNYIANTIVVIDGYDIEGTTSSNSSGYFSYITDSLTVSNTYYPTANVYSSTYSSNIQNYSNITILQIPTTITTGNIYQIVGTSQVYIDGTLTNSTLNNTISNITIDINGFDFTSNTTTDINGNFSYITNNLLVSETYSPNVVVNSPVYISNATNYTNITLTQIQSSLTTGNIYQVSGTRQVFIDGTLKNTTFNTSISNVIVEISGFDVNANIITDVNGYFNYTSDSLTLNSYTPNITISDSTYYSNLIDYSTVNLALINTTITTGNIYQVDGTSQVFIDGIITNTVLNTSVANANVYVCGLSNLNHTIQSNASGYFSYNSDDLIIRENFTPNVTVIDNIYTSSTYEYLNITISQISATITPITIYQVPGVASVYLSGSLTNTIFSSNIVSESILINGFGESANVTTNSQGIFSYTALNLIPSVSYTANATVISPTYTTTPISFTTFTVGYINADVIFQDVYQIFGTKQLNLTGVLVNSYSNANISSETINVYGLDKTYNATSGIDGIFTITTGNLSVGNYTITSNLTSSYYAASSSTPYTLVQTQVGNSAVYTYKYTPFTSNIVINSTTRNQQYSA
jgi:hypothetical protein